MLNLVTVVSSNSKSSKMYGPWVQVLMTVELVGTQVPSSALVASW